jgi:hypothetical protein
VKGGSRVEGPVTQRAPMHSARAIVIVDVLRLAATVVLAGGQ